MRLLVRIAAAVAIVYLAASVALLALMYQPPVRFAGVVGRLPAPILFPLLPFQRLWSIARAGSLRPGESAPDFDLPALDGSGRVKLSSFRGRMPVVLIFGSYT